MKLKRENYLQLIRPYYDVDLIKVITGVRRAGKSVLLETIKEELQDKGVDNAHIVISGDGKAFTNNFSLTTQKYDPYYEKGIVVVSLLGGHGACYAGTRDKIEEKRDKIWKDGLEKDYIDFGSSPPNDRQLNSLAHVLGIMCLGLRLNVDSIKTLAEVVSLDEELKIKNEKLWKDVPKKIITKDAINLAFYPNYEGTAGDVIRKRTQVVLDDMKKGLYKTIKPELADVPLVVS